MSGTKGMIHCKYRSNTLRAKAWTSMRILRSFDLQLLLVTIPGAESQSDYENLAKWLNRLERHGYVAKRGNPRRREGEYQVWQLLDGRCPTHPLSCLRCGGSLTNRRCEEKEKETKKEKNKEEEKERSAV